MSSFAGRKSIVLLAVFIVSGGFLFLRTAPIAQAAQPIHATSSYSKIYSDTLFFDNWNNLLSDFVNTWLPATMGGPLGIGFSTAPASGLSVNGPIISMGNLGIGTTNPTTFLDINALSGYAILAGNQKIGSVASPTLGSDVVTLAYLQSYASASSSSVWGGTRNSKIWNGDLGAGNVGIGTTNPINKLQVVGQAYFGNYYNNYVAGQSLSSTTLSVGGGLVVGIDDAGSGGILRLKNQSNADFRIEALNTASGGDYRWGSLSLDSGHKASGDLLNLNRYSDSDISLVLGGGKVGIGKSNPGAILDIYGDSMSLGATGTSQTLFFTNGTGQGQISWQQGSPRFYLGGNGSQAAAFDFYTNGTSNAPSIRFGSGATPTVSSLGSFAIGTTTLANAKLTIAPNGQNYSIDAGNYRIGSVASPTGNSDAATKGYVDSALNPVGALPTSTVGYWAASGNSIYNINTSNVGIGVTNPTQKLNVLGTVAATAFAGNGSGLTYVNRNVVNIPENTTSLGQWVKIGSIDFSALSYHELEVNYKVTSKFGVAEYNVRMGVSSPNGTFYSPYIYKTYTLGTNVPELELYQVDAAGQYELYLKWDSNYIQTSVTEVGFTEKQVGDSLLMAYVSTPSFISSIPSGRTKINPNNYLAFNSGNVGIGTAAPATGLDVANGFRVSGSGTPTAGAGLELSYTGQSNFTSYDRTNSLYKIINFNALSYKWQVSNVDRMVIDTTGNVGISTTSPAAKLEVAALSGYSILAGNQKIGNVALPTANSDAATKGYVDSSFAPGGSNSVWNGTTTGNIWNANTGNVGIGVTNPGSKLEVTDTMALTTTASPYQATRFLFGATNGQSSYLMQNGGGNWYSGLTLNSYYTGNNTYTYTGTNPTWKGAASILMRHDAQIQFRTIADGSSTEPPVRMAIDNTGNVGIGTTNPGSKLELLNDDIRVTRSTNSNNTEYYGVKFGNTSGFASNWWSGIRPYQTTGYDRNGLYFYTSNSAAAAIAMTVQPDGNVGIATSSPAAKLEVAALSGYSILAGNQKIGNVASPTLTNDAATKGYVDSSFAPGGSNSLWNGTTTGNIWSVNSGNVGIGVTNPIRKLEVVGAARFSANGTVATFSPSTNSRGGVFLGSAGEFSTDEAGLYDTGGNVPLAVYDATTDFIHYSHQMYVDQSNNGIVISGTLSLNTTGQDNTITVNGGIDTNNENHFYQGNYFDPVNGVLAASKMSQDIANNTTDASPFTAGIQNSGDAISHAAQTTYAGYFNNATTGVLKNYGLYVIGNTNYFSGNVGIATTSPATNLEVAALSGYSILAGNQKIGNVASPTLVNDAATKGYVDSSFAPGGSNSLWNGTTTGNIWNLNSGNVGIGTTSPIALLQSVAGAGVIPLRASKGNDAGTVLLLERTLGATGSLGIDFNSGVTNIRSLNALAFSYGSNSAGTEAMRMTNIGNVGVGTTNPGSTLAVKNSAGVSNLSIQLNNTYATTSDRVSGLYLNLPDDPVDTTNRRAYVGYGYNDYTAAYPVWNYIFKGLGIAAAKGGIHFASEGNNIDFITTAATGTPNIVFKSNGYVGIATTSPAANLEVAALSGYSILAGNQKIGNVALPTANSDAATKGYVDSSFGPGGSSSLWGGATSSNIWSMNSANVGIGITNPLYKLAVNGNIGGVSGSSGGIDTTGENLLLNSSFENGNATTPTSWSTSCGATCTFTRDNSTAYSGTYSEAVGRSVTGNWAEIGSQTLNLVSGKTYSISFWAKNDGGAIQGQWNLTNPPSSTYYCSGNTFNLTSTWQYFTFSCTSASSGTDGYIKLRANGNSTGTVWYDDVNFSEGSLASRWYPGDLLVNTAGNVGIGTTNPGAKLDIYESQINLSGTTGVSHGLLMNRGVAITTTNLQASLFEEYNGLGSGDSLTARAYSYKLQNYDGLINWLAINNSGNVAVGTTTFPNARLALSPSTQNYAVDAGSYRIGNVAAPVISGDVVTLGYLNSSLAPGGSSSLWNGTTTGNIWNSNSGNIGIGNSAPGLKLDITGNAGLPAASGATQTGSLRLSNGGQAVLDFGVQASGNGAWLQSTNNGSLGTNYPLLFNPNGGNVGIGTTAPRALLDVYGNATIGGSLIINDNATGYGTAASLKLQYDQDNNYYEIGTRFPDFFIKQNSTEFLTIKSGSGNVGISTTSPAARLEVAASSGYSILAGNQKIGNVASPTLITDAATKGYVDSSFGPGGSSSLWGGATTSDIWSLNSGNTGLGLTNPHAKLDIKPTLAASGLSKIFQFTLPYSTASEIPLLAITNSSNATTSGIAFPLSNSGTYGDIAFYNNGATFAENMRIAGSGNVGIGVTNPSSKLDLNGNFNITPVDSNGGLKFAGTNASRLYSDSGTNGLWLINSTTSKLFLGTGYDWDKYVGLTYTPGTVGAGSGQLIIGQTTKNNSFYTHGITSLYTNGLERLRITTAGNIGLTTTSPASLLEIAPYSGYTGVYSILAGNKSIGNAAAPIFDADVATMGWVNSALSYVKAFAVFVTSTPAAYDGSRGGYHAANSLCNAISSGSHVCTSEEMLYTINSSSTLPVNGTTLWISNGPPGYTVNANDCLGWGSNAHGNYGAIWFKNGVGEGYGALDYCDSTNKFACCK